VTFATWTLFFDCRTVTEQSGKESCRGEKQEWNSADVEVAAKHKVGDPKGDEVRQDSRGSSPRRSAGVGDRTEEETSCPEDGEGDLATERTWMGYLLKGCGTRKVEGERDQDRSFNPKQRGGKCSSPTIDAI